jgi:hypothetical protein
MKCNERYNTVTVTPKLGQRKMGFEKWRFRKIDGLSNGLSQDAKQKS